MGCFLGCFGGEKSPKRRKHRVNRASPRRQRNRVQNVRQEFVITAGPAVPETAPVDSVPELSELRDKPEVVKQPSPIPSTRKRVTFNSNVTTYEHVPVHESIKSLPDCAVDEQQKQDNSKSVSKDEDSMTSSVASYPPNHRYHNARQSGDEAEEYGDDSDLDDLDDEDEYEDEDDYSDEDINDRFLGRQVWSESMESRTGNSSPPATTQEVGSLMVKTHLDEEVKQCGSKSNARDRSDYVNSLLNPVENIAQWKAAKSKGPPLLKPEKENFANFEPSTFKAKSHQLQNTDQEIAVDASLSNWLSTPSKKTSFSGFDTTPTSEACPSARSFEDRPILGALTVDELRQISPASPSTRKSPSRSPDEMPIIGTVGTYWSNSSSAKHSGPATSFKGIPNTTSKYREDKKVNWHSTPFETRLDRALNKGSAQA